jgi:hypothetical protein
MNPLPDTTYVLVGRCLAPSLTDIQREDLARALARPSIRWEALLAEANRQHATPLWYSRMKTHGLLALVPEDLQAYLEQLHAANLARNRMLQEELAMILELFKRNSIPVILLKGAATFADRLYADPGARLMSDMDLLVPREQIAETERLLMMEGYVDDPTNVSLSDVWPGNTRHAHVPGLLHLKKKIAVELHFKVAYGQSGRILPVNATCAASVSGTFQGREAAWLSPHHRLLHNALHATLPHREFSRGMLRLSDLAEFAALVARYPQEIDLDRFWQVVRRSALSTEIGTYALLARLLMRTVIKPRKIRANSWHRDRLLQSSPPAVTPGKHFSKIRRKVWRMISFLYDKGRLPSWTWRNVCYGDDQTPLTARLGCIARLMLTPRMLKNVLGSPN